MENASLIIIFQLESCIYALVNGYFGTGKDSVGNKLFIHVEIKKQKYFLKKKT